MNEGELAELRTIVGDAHVLTDADVRASYERDWTGRYQGEASAVVRPASSAEVARVVQWCGARSIGLVPQGGNTGLVGGAVPSNGAIVLSTQRLQAIRDVDLDAGQVTAEAGVTLAALAASVQRTGWEPGVDLGARESATIGGLVATNAGGIRVLRYGSMRANLLGVEAVLGDGSTISRLDGLVKDNTGYDLAGLLCGSEGTLGVVTAARLRLVPDWPDRVVAWVGCRSWGEAVGVATTVRREVEGIDGLEAVDRAGIALAASSLGLADPLGTAHDDVEVGLLVAWAGRGDPGPRLGEVLQDRPQAVAVEPGARARIWAIRERQAEAIALVGVPHKLDVTVPVRRLAEFAIAVRETVAGSHPEARLFLFGHLGDGNLHVNIVGCDPEDTTVDDAVLRLVAATGGSISAEHGIGRAKARWLHLARSEAELDAFRALKSALDPHGILNPGVLLP